MEMTGYFAISRAGHDKDSVYIIVGSDAKYFFLCDGKLKKLAKPKKKSKKHIQLTTVKVGEELYAKLVNREKVYDEEIKYALRIYNETHRKF